MTIEKIKTRASPNIALIKYWGKVETESNDDSRRNLATNPSLSMTLSKAFTEVEIFPSKGKTGLNLRVQGQEASPKDHKKIEAHMSRVFQFYKTDPKPFLDRGIEIHSSNNFPMGTGMASSASAFAALTLAFTGLALGKKRAKEILQTQTGELSSLARRGSGSACRSLEGPWVFWEGEYARKIPVEWKLLDTLLIVSKEHKKIPSSQGHLAATSSPLFQKRLKNLEIRSPKILDALKSKNLKALGPLIEEEALELHAVAKSGTPPADYLSESTLKVLNSLPPNSSRDYFFTLDAGPNIHFLSERPIQKELLQMTQKLGIQDCEIWEDCAGSGPILFE